MGLSPPIEEYERTWRESVFVHDGCRLEKLKKYCTDFSRRDLFYTKNLCTTDHQRLVGKTPNPYLGGPCALQVETTILVSFQ
jgi:hypothetical protein